MQNLRTPKVLLDRWLGGPSPAGQAAQNITSAPLQEIVWSARSHDDHDDDHNLLIVTRIISLRMTSRPNHPDNLQPSWRSKIAWRWIFWPKKADFSGFFLYIYIFLYSLYSFWQPLLLGLHKLLFKKKFIFHDQCEHGHRHQQVEGHVRKFQQLYYQSCHNNNFDLQTITSSHHRHNAFEAELEYLWDIFFVHP